MAAKSVKKSPVQSMEQVEKAWKKQYFAEANFPEWTRSQKAITTPLVLPDSVELTEGRLLGSEAEGRCLLCDRAYSIPSKQDLLLGHMLEEHYIVISDVHTISDLPSYLNYWKAKLESGVSIVEFASQLSAEVSSKDKNEPKEAQFYMLSDVLREDRDLRVKLQMKRLQQVLDIQEKERQDKTFKRACLFCRTDFEGNHLDYFNHMAFSHNFSVGQPYNLVFIKDLLDTIEAKLESTLCIYCEKTFKSREVLKEHMRKKGHKKINPRNKLYDRFYIVNYLEFGKNWETVSKEPDFEDQPDVLPTGFDNQEEGVRNGGDDFEDEEEDGDEVDWSDWRRDFSGAVCLFCDAVYMDAAELLNHMTSLHNFDFNHARNSLKLTFYQQIKLINYLRRQMHLNACVFCLESFSSRKEVVQHMEDLDHARVPDDRDEWDQPQYFFPTYENDNLLLFLDDDHLKTGKLGNIRNEEVPDDASAVIAEDIEIKESILSEEEFRRSICPGAKIDKRKN